MITLKVDVSTLVTLKDPLWSDYGQAEAPRQNRSESGGGVIRVTELGDPGNVISMGFRDVEQADYEALRDFIKDDMQYSGVTFTFTDSFGDDHTGMLYWSGLETWKPGKGGRWRGQLVIKRNLGA